MLVLLFLNLCCVIVIRSEPTAPTCIVPLTQYGNSILAADLAIGTPPQLVTLFLQTISSETFVFDSTIDLGSFGGKKDNYNHSKSLTYKRTYDISWETGAKTSQISGANGEVATDTFLVNFMILMSRKGGPIPPIFAHKAQIWGNYVVRNIDFAYMVDQSEKARHAVTESSLDGEKSEGSAQQKKITAIAGNLIELYESRQVKKNTAAGLGSSGLRAYIVSKFVNLFNVFIQFTVLLYFVGSANVGWGFKIIGNALAGINWTQTGYFPRVSFCTFTHNSLAQLQTRSVQCVLMINMLNEKICLMLYFWFLVLFVLTVINIVSTVVRHATTFGRRRTIERYLSMHPNKNYLDRVKYADFQLGDDGLLLLRFIENNCGFLIASKVACQYYDALKNQKIDQFSSC
ncbi:innexin domain-containing protein [Ditylenchus destructor]|nr:innexin domain-containing protein [Ditylenchus destructor]